MIVTEVFDETAIVLIGNVADVAPAGIVTDAGSVALGELDVNETTVPPGPAGPFRVAVPVEGDPPMTLFGETLIPIKDAGLIVRVAVFVVPP